MTSDDQQPELEETLRSRLAAAVPPGPSVTGWAERAAARARKRRARRRQALAVVSASCVAAAIAVGAASFEGNSDGQAPDTDRAPAIVLTPQPPEGMRYVGINNVVVAVPNAWDLRIGGCYDLTDEDAVVVPGYSWLTCARIGPRPDVSLLRILPTDDANAEGLIEDAQPAGEINGIRVLRTPTSRSQTNGGKLLSLFQTPERSSGWRHHPPTSSSRSSTRSPESPTARSPSPARRLHGHAFATAFRPRA